MVKKKSAGNSATKMVYASIVAMAFILMGAMVTTASGREFLLPPSLDMEFNGEQRFFDLRVPPTYDAAVPAPLILALHAGGGSASRMEYISGISEAALPRGYIVVYPEGLDGDWNDGRDIKASRAARQHVDDVGFLNTLIDKVIAHYNIDRQRIYVMGHASGGMMALRFACEASRRVAAVAALDALLPVESIEWCRQREPVPAMFLIQRNSPHLPFEGGPLQFVRLHRGEVIGAAESASSWALGNGCMMDARQPPGGNGILEQWHFAGCGQEREVRLVAIDGSGLDFPGGKDVWTMRHMNGTPTTFDTVAAMLEFFDSHRKAGPAGVSELDVVQ